MRRNMSSNQQEIKCPICGSINLSSKKYCVNCGNKLEYVLNQKANTESLNLADQENLHQYPCSKCGTLNLNNAKFCRSCGEKRIIGKPISEKDKDEIKRYSRENYSTLRHGILFLYLVLFIPILIIYYIIDIYVISIYFPELININFVLVIYFYLVFRCLFPSGPAWGGEEKQEIYKFDAYQYTDNFRLSINLIVNFGAITLALFFYFTVFKFSGYVPLLIEFLYSIFDIISIILLIIYVYIGHSEFFLLKYLGKDLEKYWNFQDDLAKNIFLNKGEPWDKIKSTYSKSMGRLLIVYLKSIPIYAGVNLIKLILLGEIFNITPMSIVYLVSDFIVFTLVEYILILYIAHLYGNYQELTFRWNV